MMSRTATKPWTLALFGILFSCVACGPARHEASLSKPVGSSAHGLLPDSPFFLACLGSVSTPENRSPFLKETLEIAGTDDCFKALEVLHTKDDFSFASAISREDFPLLAGVVVNAKSVTLKRARLETVEVFAALTKIEVLNIIDNETTLDLSAFANGTPATLVRLLVKQTRVVNSNALASLPNLRSVTFVMHGAP